MTEDFRHGIDWQKAVEGVPTFEYAIEDMDMSDTGQLSEALDNFVFYMQEGSWSFLTWEAVVREEQDLPLSEKHKQSLSALIGFDHDVIHYIDDTPRPHEPWYETLRRLASHLPVASFNTAEPQFEVTTEGWPKLAEALRKHGKHISLPEGIDDPFGVIPLNLQHRLWLQSCLDELLGIGYRRGEDDVISLEQKDEHHRIDNFVEALREHKEDIRALELTLEKLWDFLSMPEKDKDIFTKIFSKTLGLKSNTDPIAEHL